MIKYEEFFWRYLFDNLCGFCIWVCFPVILVCFLLWYCWNSALSHWLGIFLPHLFLEFRSMIFSCCPVFPVCSFPVLLIFIFFAYLTSRCFTLVQSWQSIFCLTCSAWEALAFCFLAESSCFSIPSLFHLESSSVFLFTEFCSQELYYLHHLY